MSQAVIDSTIPSLPLPTRPLPIAQPIGNAWMPVIYDGTVATEWLRYERFKRKTKATAAEALDYAGRTIWYRQRRENERRRHLEILQGNLLRQTRLSPDEAMTVAERVWRSWPNEKRRRIEALSHPRFAYLEAAE